MTAAGVGGPPPIRGVLFDKDGTLFDFHASWGAWAQGFLLDESAGDPRLAAHLADILGFDLARARFRPDSVAVASTTETVAGLLLPLLPSSTLDDLVARMDARAAALPQVEAAPLRPLLLSLRDRDLALGVATNDSEAPARAHLAGLLDLLPFVVGYDSGHGSKPGPGQLLAFARHAGLAPAACAMVGDSLHDLVAARAAGMRAVAVLTGVAGREDLTPAADVVLGSVADLPAWLDAL